MKRQSSTSVPTVYKLVIPCAIIFVFAILIMMIFIGRKGNNGHHSTYRLPDEAKYFSGALYSRITRDDSVFSCYESSSKEEMSAYIDACLEFGWVEDFRSDVSWYGSWKDRDSEWKLSVVLDTYHDNKISIDVSREEKEDK